MHLLFVQKDERLSRTVARSFAPDFSCAMDFPCPLLWTKPGSDAVSLAEILENAEAVFEVWHQLHGTKPGLFWGNLFCLRKSSLNIWPGIVSVSLQCHVTSNL